MNTVKLNKLGRLTALISFLLGTLIMALYYLTSAGELAFIGYGYVFLAGIINLVVLALIVFKAIFNKTDNKGLFKTGGLMLLNVPVALIYCWFAMMLTGYMRITFANSTQKVLTDINIIGCETKHIDKIEPGERTTVWVGITGDCSITIDYLSGDKRIKETAVGYTTNGGGERVYHDIDGKE